MKKGCSNVITAAFISLYRFKIGSTVLAQRTDEVIRQGISFIDVSAHLADKTFASFCLRFWLDVVLIVGVGHRRCAVDDAGFGYGTDKHAMGSQILVVFHFQREEGVDVLRQEDQSVIGTQDLLFILKLIRISSGLETELLEHLERCIRIETVDIHDAGLLNDVMRIIGLIDGNHDPERIVGQLNNRVDDQTVVFLAVIGCDHIESVADGEQRLHVVLIRMRTVSGEVFGTHRCRKGTDLFQIGVIQGSFSSIVFIVRAAKGAQEPFSMKPILRFWKLRSVRWWINSFMNG